MNFHSSCLCPECWKYKCLVYAEVGVEAGASDTQENSLPAEGQTSALLVFILQTPWLQAPPGLAILLKSISGRLGCRQHKGAIFWWSLAG